jgi:hypothetical protein
VAPIVWFLLVALAMIGQALGAERSARTTPEGPVGSETMLIHVADDLLTVKLQGVPLETVLREIERRTTIGIFRAGPLTQHITIEFQALPLEEGLRRLLRGHGWMMLHTSSGMQQGSTVTQVMVLSADAREHPGSFAGTPATTREHTAVLALHALAAREEVKSQLEVYIHGPDAKARKEAFQDLIAAVDVEEFQLVIAMLQDRTIQPGTWETALAPLSELMAVEEQQLLLASLQDPAARESMVRTLESYLKYKTREEAKSQ